MPQSVTDLFVKKGYVASSQEDPLISKAVDFGIQFWEDKRGQLSLLNLFFHKIIKAMLVKAATPWSDHLLIYLAIAFRLT